MKILLGMKKVKYLMVLILSVAVVSPAMAKKKSKKSKKGSSSSSEYQDYAVEGEGGYGYIPRSSENNRYGNSDGGKTEVTDVKKKVKAEAAKLSFNSTYELKEYLQKLLKTRNCGRRGKVAIQTALKNLEKLKNLDNKAMVTMAKKCLGEIAKIDKKKEIKEIKTSDSFYVPVERVMIGPLGIHVDFDQKLAMMKVSDVEVKGPCHEKLKVGDILVGSGKNNFATLDKFVEKGVESFNPRCRTMVQFTSAIDRAEGSKTGILPLTIRRNGKIGRVAVKLNRIGSYSSTYPFNCKKSRIIASKACDEIVKAFKSKAWGQPGDAKGSAVGKGATGYETGLCGLALLAQPDRKKYMPVIKKVVETLNQMPDEQLTGGEYLCNTYVALFLCEYYLATKDKTAKATIQRMYKRYLEGAQPYGGWGHKFRKGTYGGGGYAISTGHVFMAIGLMSKCINIDSSRTRQTLDHLCAPYERGAITYMGSWKINEDKENIEPSEIARGGDSVSRTGTTALGFSLLGKDPYNMMPSIMAYLSDPKTYIRYYLPHCCHVIGQFPCTVAVARENPMAFRAHMDAEKWWYTLGRRYDGELLLGPVFKKQRVRNEFQKKYGLMAACGCVALIHSIDQRQLYMFRSVKAFKDIKKMTNYRQWNEWLLSQKGNEPKRPCVINPPSKPKKFPAKVKQMEYISEEITFADGKNVTFEADVLSGDWEAFLLVRHRQNKSLYWTVVKRGNDDCAWLRNGKVIMDHGAKESGLVGKDAWREADKCLEECKRVVVTLRPKACLSNGGGWLKAHRLEFYDK